MKTIYFLEQHGNFHFYEPYCVYTLKQTTKQTLQNLHMRFNRFTSGRTEM